MKNAAAVVLVLAIDNFIVYWQAVLGCVGAIDDLDRLSALLPASSVETVVPILDGELRSDQESFASEFD